MNTLTACFLSALIIGITATLVMDIWGALRQRAFAIAAPNYGLVGRWILHMRHGQFQHDAISRSAPIARETLVGWLAHYMIGIAFAGLLLVVAGPGWHGSTTLLPGYPYSSAWLPWRPLFCSCSRAWGQASPPRAPRHRTRPGCKACSTMACSAWACIPAAGPATSSCTSPDRKKAKTRGKMR